MILGAHVKCDKIAEYVRYDVILSRKTKRVMPFTSVMSLDAAAADMCKEGCLMEDEQSRALAKVPTDLLTTRN